MKRIVVLGSTGSVGTQTLDIVREHRDAFEVVGLSARDNVDLLRRQVQEFQAPQCVVGSRQAAARLQEIAPNLASQCQGFGPEALEDLASVDCDIVVNALLGYAGLQPTLAALEAGHDVALANKESMVVAGELVQRTARRNDSRIFPVDSEHSALDQCLRAGRPHEVRRLILTASGGPFHTWPESRLRQVTQADALNHPTWNMGDKITIDSATLMNKGLEILEARWLFDIDFDRIDVLVHPQSIVHSMVEFRDGAVMAHLGQPDMRMPLWYALHAGERPGADFPRLDLAAVSELSFEKLDHHKFPCVDLAVSAGSTGGTAPAILNAANEIAVAAFLAKEIHYLDIPRVIAATLKEVPVEAVTGLDLESIQRADREARQAAQRFLSDPVATRDRSC